MTYEQWENRPVFRVGRITWTVAQRLAGRSGDCCPTSEIYSPPWCLRVLREYRTPSMKAFRDRVAAELRQMRRVSKRIRTPEQTNSLILQQRLQRFNEKPGPRVGDYLKLDNWNYTRFTHEWPDTIQTGGMGGSYYLSESGFLSYSGSCDPGVPKDCLELTEETKPGAVWFFSEDHHRAHNSVTFVVPLRVYRKARQ